MNSSVRRPESWYDSLVDAVGGFGSATKLIQGSLMVVPAGLIDRPASPRIMLSTSLVPEQMRIDLGPLVQRSAVPILNAMRQRRRAESVSFSRYLVSDLGFKERTPFLRIRERIAHVGLRLCPADLAPMLALNLKKEFTLEEHVSLVSGMEPIRCADGIERIFELYGIEDGKTQLMGVMPSAFEPEQELLLALPL